MSFQEATALTNSCQNHPEFDGSTPAGNCTPCKRLRRAWKEARGLKGQFGRPAVNGPQAGMVPATVIPITFNDRVLAAVKRQPLTLTEVASKVESTPGAALDALLGLQQAGHNLHELGGKWSVEKLMPTNLGEIGPYLSRPDGSYVFGFISDNHLGSKYARHDVMNDLYRKFAAAGVDRVFNAGNWIDGEARFNKFDLNVYGMDGQIAHLVDAYPNVGLTTYAVAGDDHEGWVAQREGVDIGRYAERAMRAAGRTDWVNLGYMEAYVPLQHTATGATSMLHVMHPGGGSAYAVSHTVQKIVESYGSGDKPAVLLAGHYHKLEFINIRGVWVVQTGCTQDVTPFARKKKLNFAIGGGIMRLTQNPETGAIEHAGVDMFQYFNRGYYNNRWSYSGDVVLPDRGVA